MKESFSFKTWNLKNTFYFNQHTKISRNFTRISQTKNEISQIYVLFSYTWSVIIELYIHIFLYLPLHFVLFSTRRNGKQGQIRAANNIKPQNVTQCTIAPLPSAYPRSLQTWYWPLLYCAEVYSRPCQTSKTELLAKINNGFSLKKYLKANFWAVNSFYSSDLLFFF